MARPPHRAILLTGRPGIGKTTVIRRLAERLTELAPAVRIAGFYTEEIRERGQRVGFRAVTFTGGDAVIAHVDFDPRLRVGKYGVDVGAVDHLADATLRLETGADLYLIDEIGKMECLSARLVAAVRRLLDAPTWIVATVASRGTGLISEVKRRPDVLLREVTMANRSDMAAKIAPWLAERLGGG